MDVHLTEGGDIAISPSGDLAITESPWRDLLQQAYIRVLTDVEDYLLYPELGASLSELIGMPQSPQTGAYGVALIESALNREGVFTGRSFSVTPIPTGPQSIRFDIKVSTGTRNFVTLSVEQQL